MTTTPEEDPAPTIMDPTGIETVSDGTDPNTSDLSDDVSPDMLEEGKSDNR